MAVGRTGGNTAGIGIGGILVIVGIVVALFWSLILGIIIALVATWRELALEPARARAQRDDFRRVNVLLAETEERVKVWFASGPIGDVDRALGRHDDIAAMWKVERAREAAWVNGETLRALRRLPRLRSQFLVTLDRMVGLASRGLLLPLAPPG